ncbi:glucose-6-phosphate dehydrogenase [Thiohalorhabdus sp.]|uniref:glucose-6-phosphate dehydrogenase n=1 Tax=Thiohalorhabdus sp. TaxID=3094134 RepID=UPI002FC2BDDF
MAEAGTGSPDIVQTPRGPAAPCVLVIFGGSGDLAQRKLIPALYNLAEEGLLPEQFAIVGVGSTDLGDEGYRERIGDTVPRHLTKACDPERWRWFSERLHYVQADFGDGEAYEALARRLEEVAETFHTGPSFLFYLATPPTFFQTIIEHLGAAGLTRQDRGWRRVIIEKPFGRDLDSARELNAAIGEILDEDQIYRIDHYLGKETVQNILVFRFANGIFEPIWNRFYVDHVQITVAETVGVETRGRYYDRAGALRDMVPNHLFQLLSLIAMEPPNSFDANAVRDEKAKILQGIQPIGQEQVLHRVIRGQYGAGEIEGLGEVPGYRGESEVDPASATETHVAMKLLVDNWRWADVPFYLRTGKRMPRRVTEIAIQFKRAPYVLFRDTPVHHLPPNQLLIRIAPEEGISLRFGAKVPGPGLRMGNVEMDFAYADHFGSSPATGYETLLYDAMNGDATLFQRADSVELGWSVIQPILDVWGALPPRAFPNYAAGTWGPWEADELLGRDGRAWRKC